MMQWLCRGQYSPKSSIEMNALSMCLTKLLEICARYQPLLLKHVFPASVQVWRVVVNAHWKDQKRQSGRPCCSLIGAVSSVHSFAGQGPGTVSNLWQDM